MTLSTKNFHRWNKWKMLYPAARYHVQRFDDLLLLFYTALNRLVAGARVFHLNANRYRYSERRCFLREERILFQKFDSFTVHRRHTNVPNFSFPSLYSLEHVLQAVLIASEFKQRRRLHCTTSKEFRSRAFWNWARSTCRYSRKQAPSVR